MKKLIFTLLVFSIGYSTSLAQYKGQWRALHGIEIPVTTGFFGLGFTGEYFPLNYFSVASSFSFYVPSQGNARGFDINAHYYLTEKQRQWYALFGYGYYVRIPEFPGELIDRSNSINVGFGGMIKVLDELGFSPEIRYQPIGRNDLMFKLSVVYFIN